MSDAHFQTYNEMKDFLEFTQQDIDNLVSLYPVFEKHGQSITNNFYDSLLKYPKTAGIIEGRVDSLKATHGRWLMTLFKGDYDRDFFDWQYKIGQIHVTNNIRPEFVDVVTSVLRTYGKLAIFEELGMSDEAQSKSTSMCKALDLCLLTINLAYGDERIARMSKVTGMSRKLIENLIKRGA